MSRLCLELLMQITVGIRDWGTLRVQHFVSRPRLIVLLVRELVIPSVKLATLDELFDPAVCGIRGRMPLRRAVQFSCSLDSCPDATAASSPAHEQGLSPDPNPLGSHCRRALDA